MKKSFLVRFALLVNILLSLSVYAMSSTLVFGNASDLLVLSGIKEIYSAQESIDLLVYNNTGKTLFFSCPVEKKINGDWREIISSIDAKDFSKKTRVWELPPKQSLKLNWDRKQQQTFSRGVASGIFRFKVDIKRELGGEVIGKIFSKEFKVSTVEEKR